MSSETAAQPVTRRCHQCPETFTYQNGVTKIDEAFAIEVGSWLTVMGEVTRPALDPYGKQIGVQIVPDIKMFCSAECLADFINPLVAEFKAIEEAALAKLAEKQKNWPARYGPDLAAWEKSAQAVGEPHVTL